MDTVKIIKTPADHEAALARLDELMDTDPAPNSDDDMEMQALAVLIAAYEDKHYKIDTSSVTPLDIICFRMEQNGLTAKDMAAYLGSPSKVSEVLSGKRPLSLTMIKKLHHGLKIPADLLIRL
ncbi:Predicted transcription regulator containing HTH domain [Kingella potus]|uniref:Predicted transcription regulator containing HTH domain n=1 Tax=Kingella potus TaxID=265175 RepID=A0A377R0N3_9NEIS|nr:helix-turn-helix domain-containing protein [Kingella potus]UOP01319.1 helix-turn-helix domain-containing protein [Kingella potus]STR00368.1 Predicted transcription regulator containing HTH domain [Kingella potus]